MPAARMNLLLAVAAMAAGCGEKRPPPESDLKARLVAAGIPASAMTSTRDDYDQEVFALKVDGAAFRRLDKPKLAKLVLDSRYRFEFTDPGQVHAFALYVGAETHDRDEAKALAELKARGELDKIPRYHAGEPMRSFANRMELYCGIEPGAALVVRDAAWLDWNNPSYPRELVGAGAEGVTVAQLRALESFDCLKRIIDATKVRRHFIGNRGREGAIDY